MAETQSTPLERAYRLIQEERLDDALGILRPFLDKDPNNAAGWWLYANAVSDPNQARQALETVLRLDPKHAEARELLDQLNEATPGSEGGFGDLNLSDPFAGLRPSAATTDEPAHGMEIDNPFADSSEATSLFESDAAPSFVAEGGAKPPRDFTVGDDDALAGSPTVPAKAPAALSRAPRRRSPIITALMGLLVILIVVLGGLLVAQKLAIAPSSTTTATVLAVLPTNGVTSVATVAATVNVIAPVVAATTAATPPPENVTAEATISAATANLPTETEAVTTAVTAIAPTGSATAVASASEAVTTVPTSEANASAAGTSASPSDAMNTAQQQAIAQFTANGLTNAKAAVDTSSLGQTLTVSFCSPFGPQLTNKVNQAMDLLAAQAVPISGQVQAISVEVYNCVNTSQLEFKAVSPIADVLAYVNKSLTVRQFRAGWKVN